MSVRKTYLKNKGYIRKDGSIKFTKVTMFCLPMLGFHFKDFGDSLLNVYSTHDESPHLYVVILNPYKDNPGLNIVLDKLRSHPNFVEETKDDDEYEIILKLKLDSNHEDDYYKVMSGDYSKISEDYKKILTRLYSDFKHDLNLPPKINADGLVDTSMAEVLDPSLEKKKIVAKHFGVELSSVKELISKPDLRYELYRTIEELNSEEEIV